MIYSLLLPEYIHYIQHQFVWKLSLQNQVVDVWLVMNLAKEEQRLQLYQFVILFQAFVSDWFQWYVKQ